MAGNGTTRSVQRLSEGWLFCRIQPGNNAAPQSGDPAPTQACTDFDDAGWERVRVPHDWAITGPFDSDHDRQVTRVIEDGEERAREYLGRTGGLPHVGTAWYRRSLDLPADDGRRLYVEFDGVMCNSRVYLNGDFVGSWPYGYSSFCFDLTEHVRWGADNILAVSVDVKPSASRWYPGAGIYRHVRLVSVDPIHVAHWGTRVTASEITPETATVAIRTEIESSSGRTEDIELRTDILDPHGREVASITSSARIETAASIDQEVRVESPTLWSIDAPNCYQALTSVIADGRTVDGYETTFGIREIRFDVADGFVLNGRPVELKGVCMHHDLGPLGAAVSARAIERQCETLVEMGCNAVRTSHNPPAPELLEICDRMGIVVIDEAFDEWRLAKCENGYNRLFDEWAERDVRALIRRDRNHPCVIMWSIGNEIREQGSEDGAQVAQFLVDICHDEDPTRPTTAGFNQPDAAIANGLAGVVDVPGWNYSATRYAEFRRDHPTWPMYGSETESCLSTRGEYHFPAVEEKTARKEHDPHQMSSYDLSSPPWGYAPDIEFAGQDDNPTLFGAFVWTGYDYLGEPTPYNHVWPSRSSYFGIVDLCGLPKDRYYIYRSKWRPETETLYLLPHWNWEDRRGEVTPVHCYTSCDAAELFLNGVSQGVRRKDPASVYDRYRLRWDEVVYEPGVLEVVALGSDAEPMATARMQTAGDPSRIELTPDRATITADGDDLAFVTVAITDSDGTTCPLADDLLRFELDGPGCIATVDNGDPTSTDPFLADRCRAFHGLCVLVVRSLAGAAGPLRIRATATGLAPAETVVTSA